MKRKQLMTFEEQYLLPIVTGVFYFLFALFVHLLSSGFIKKASKNILQPIDQADDLQEEVLKHLNGNIKTTVLTNQFNIATQLKNYYRNLAVSYYQNYYVFTICSIVYTI